jgi:hypothetical protein
MVFILVIPVGISDMIRIWDVSGEAKVVQPGSRASVIILNAGTGRGMRDLFSIYNAHVGRKCRSRKAKTASAACSLTRRR